MPTAAGLNVAVDAEPRIWIQKYYDSFNGIRGLAVLLVYCSHFLWIAPLFVLNNLSHFGFLGVELFFVLSGFLITGILYDVLPEQNYFRNFYIRRSLRIFPLFYGLYTIALILSAFGLLHPDRYVPLFMVYLGNFLPVINRSTAATNVFTTVVHGTRFTALSMGHFWSLCVEEQFYLVWPAVVWLVKDRRTLMRISAIGIVATPLLRTAIFLHLGQDAITSRLLYRITFTRCDTLLFGAWLALYLRGAVLSRQQLHRKGHALLLIGGAVALIAGCWNWGTYHFEDSPFTHTFGFSAIAAAATGAVMLSLDSTSWISRLFRLRPLSRLGVVSYGFYVYHGLPGVFLNEFYKYHADYLHTHHAIRLSIFLGWLVLSWLLAELSFRYFETPILALKSRLAPEMKRIHLQIPAQREPSL